MSRLIEVTKDPVSGEYTVNTAASGGAVLVDNVNATIDASTYSTPVEVVPAEGIDGMRKATVSLSNLPNIELNKAETIDVSAYTTPVEITPTAGAAGMAKATVTLSNIPSGGTTLYAWWDDNNNYCVYTTSPVPAVGSHVYRGDSTHIRDTNFKVRSISDNTITYGSGGGGGGGALYTATATRDSSIDVSFDSSPALIGIDSCYICYKELSSGAHVVYFVYDSTKNLSMDYDDSGWQTSTITNYAGLPLGIGVAESNSLESSIQNLQINYDGRTYTINNFTSVLSDSSYTNVTTFI